MTFLPWPNPMCVVGHICGVAPLCCRRAMGISLCEVFRLPFLPGRAEGAIGTGLARPRLARCWGTCVWLARTDG